jgi:hypothetical protein
MAPRIFFSASTAASFPVGIAGSTWRPLIGSRTIWHVHMDNQAVGSQLATLELSGSNLAERLLENNTTCIASRVVLESRHGKHETVS